MSRTAGAGGCRCCRREGSASSPGRAPRSGAGAPDRAQVPAAAPHRGARSRHHQTSFPPPIKSVLSARLESSCLRAAQDALCATEAGGMGCRWLPHRIAPSLSCSGPGGHRCRAAGGCHRPAVPGGAGRERRSAGPRSPPGSRIPLLGPVTYPEGCQGLYGVCQALSTSVFSGILIDKLRRC